MTVTRLKQEAKFTSLYGDPLIRQTINLLSFTTMIQFTD